jgi:hypothetical protein
LHYHELGGGGLKASNKYVKEKMGSMFHASCCFLGHMAEAGKTELHKDKARTDDSSRTTLPSTALFIAECTKPATHS